MYYSSHSELTFEWRLNPKLKNTPKKRSEKPLFPLAEASLFPLHCSVEKRQSSPLPARGSESKTRRHVDSEGLMSLEPHRQDFRDRVAFSLHKQGAGDLARILRSESNVGEPASERIERDREREKRQGVNECLW
ncbi:hypothetical protein V2G26_002006 [Clonostachys chloroleuca]